MGDNQDGKVNFNYIFKAMEVEILPQPRAGTQSLYESFPPSSPPLCLLILTKKLCLEILQLLILFQFMPYPPT